MRRQVHFDGRSHSRSKKNPREDDQVNAPLSRWWLLPLNWLEEIEHWREAKRRGHAAGEPVVTAQESYVSVPFVRDNPTHKDTFWISIAAFRMWLTWGILGAVGAAGGIGSLYWNPSLARSDIIFFATTSTLFFLIGMASWLMVWLHIRNARSPNSDLRRAGYVLQERIPLWNYFSKRFPRLHIAQPASDSDKLFSPANIHAQSEPAPFPFEIIQAGHPEYEKIFSLGLTGDDAVLHAAESLARYADELQARNKNAQVVVRIAVKLSDAAAWRSFGFEPLAFSPTLLGFPTDAEKEKFLELSGSENLRAALLSEKSFKVLKRTNDLSALREEQEKQLEPRIQGLLAFLQERARLTDSALRPHDEKEFTAEIHDLVDVPGRVVRLHERLEDSLNAIRIQIGQFLDNDEQDLRRRIEKASQPRPKPVIVEQPHFAGLDRKAGETWLMRVASAMSGQNITDMDQAIVVFSFNPQILDFMNIHIKTLDQLIRVDSPTDAIAAEIDGILMAPTYVSTMLPPHRKRNSREKRWRLF